MPLKQLPFASALPAPRPELAVVLGSGWDCAAELIETPEDIPYPELPHDASPRLQR
jgi:hypothetical protein